MLGHPWRRGLQGLEPSGSGGGLRLMGARRGHRVAVATAFPAGGRPHLSKWSTLREPRTIIQVAPTPPLPKGLEVWAQAVDPDRSVTPEMHAAGPARVRTDEPDSTAKLLADEGVRRTLVELVHTDESGRILDGVLELRLPGVLTPEELETAVARAVDLAAATVAPIDTAWRRLAEEHALELTPSEPDGTRSASGHIMGGLLLRLSARVDEDGVRRTRARLGLPPGVPRGLTIQASSGDVAHEIPLPEDHPLRGEILCGGADAAAVVERLSMDDVVDGLREVVLEWPDTSVHEGMVEAHLEGVLWHDLGERIETMGVLAWLLAGEPPEAVPRL